MEDAYRFEIWQQIRTNDQDEKSLPGTDRSRQQEGSFGLPSFEGLYRSIFTDADHKKDTETSVCSDNSEPSFSIDSIIRGDNLSNPRSSTPDIEGKQAEIPCDIKVNQSESPFEARDNVVVSSVTQNSRADETVSSRTTAEERIPPQVPVTKTKSRKLDKPPYTYAAMVITAIETSPDKALTIADVRAALRLMFPFFRGPYTGWKESVRHCLSRSNIFYCKSRGNTQGKGVWKVDHSLLKPEMFRRTKHGYPTSVYKTYLHEELGLEPVCSGEKPSGSISNILLPAHQCYRDSPTVTTQISCSDDFLRARKDVDDTGSDATSPDDSSVSSDLSVESLLGKRKQETVSEQAAKRTKTSSTKPSSSSETPASSSISSAHTSAPYPGSSSYNLSYNQIAQYPQYPYQAYHQMTMYQQTPSFYPYSEQPIPFYRQAQFDPYQTGYQGNTAPWGSYNNYLPHTTGLQAAMNMWYYRQCRASMAGHKDTQEYAYDYSWYAPPETDAATATSVDPQPSLEKE